MRSMSTHDKDSGKQVMTVRALLAEPLRALPELPVIRHAYCSKETVDAAVSWLSSERSDLLMKLLDEETAIRNIMYYEAIAKIMNVLRKEAGAQIDVPQTELGMVDLLYEISRRLRKAYGLTDIPPRGKPLAPSPNGPFPPMLAVKVSQRNEERGATQEIVDTVLADFYDQRPDLWFVASEAAQRNLGFGIVQREMWSLLRKNILKRGFAEDVEHKVRQKGDLSSLLSACRVEFMSRVHAMSDNPCPPPKPEL